MFLVATLTVLTVMADAISAAHDVPEDHIVLISSDTDQSNVGQWRDVQLTRVLDDDLPEWIWDYAADCLLPDHQALSLDMSLVLYDRLLRSHLPAVEVAGLLNELLAVEHDLFINVVSAFGELNERSAAITAALTDFHVDADFAEIPELVLDEIHAIIAAREDGDRRYRDLGVSRPQSHLEHAIPHDVICTVSSRYPPPFNSIYPFNHEIAKELLESAHVRHHLLNRNVLRALLRFGLRFNVSLARDISDDDTLSQIHPLLGPIPAKDPFQDFHVLFGHPRKIQIMFQSPEVRRRILTNKEAFVGAIFNIILINAGVDSLRLLTEQPFFPEIASARAPQFENLIGFWTPPMTLTQYAAVNGLFMILQILVKERLSRALNTSPDNVMIEFLAEIGIPLFQLLITDITPVVVAFTLIVIVLMDWYNSSAISIIFIFLFLINLFLTESRLAGYCAPWLRLRCDSSTWKHFTVMSLFWVIFLYYFSTSVFRLI